MIIWKSSEERERKRERKKKKEKKERKRKRKKKKECFSCFFFQIKYQLKMYQELMKYQKAMRNITNFYPTMN